MYICTYMLNLKKKIPHFKKYKCILNKMWIVYVSACVIYLKQSVNFFILTLKMNYRSLLVNANIFCV